MQAAVRSSYGPPSVIRLKEVEVPVPKEGEVLIRVRATTVNRTDCANLTAKPFIMRFVLGLPKPRQPILGTDFSGEVVKTGGSVSKFQVGDRVFGFRDIGLASQAEYLCLAESGPLLHIPEKLSFAEAAASLEGAHYAYSFVQKTHIQAGQKVLINGATGAIGSALLQMVRQYDVQITATANPANLKQIQALGADQVIDFTQEDFTRLPATFDYIFDAVGKSTFGRCKPLLPPTGIYISSELGPYAQNLWFALSTPIIGKRKLIFPIPYPTERSLPYIQERLANGSFRPLIDRTYSLSEIEQAYSYVLTGQKTGNVIIEMDG